MRAFHEVNSIGNSVAPADLTYEFDSRPVNCTYEFKQGLSEPNILGETRKEELTNGPPWRAKGVGLECTHFPRKGGFL